MKATIIGVGPPEALESRRALFGALSNAIDVEFVPTGDFARDMTAVVWFGDEPHTVGKPTMVLSEGRGQPSGTRTVRFERSELLNRHIRGWAIRDDAVAEAGSLLATPGADVLATSAERPVWTSRRTRDFRVDHATVVPAELGPGETLRTRLAPSSFFGLLPLLQFIRSVGRERLWHRPQVRATFILDDPNLHSARYGFIDFRQVVKRATQVGFHVSVATIPLDGWFIQRKAAELFRTHPRQLSLLMHGNDHTRHELAVGRAETARLTMIAQALRRTEAIEKRLGVPIPRVTTAPHGRCSEEVAIDMARLDVESLCITRPFPWLDHPPPRMPLTGWFPADTSTPMPVVERMHFTGAADELPLRAFLGQPIVLYGHHWDLADGLGMLEWWAEQVAALGSVDWSPVGSISRGLVSWRLEGETLRVRPHTRRVDFEVPAGAAHLIVDRPETHDYEITQRFGPFGEAGTAAYSDLSGRAPLASGVQEKESIRLRAATAVDLGRLPNPAWSPWPMTRRLLGEMRDRSRPLVHEMRRRSAGAIAKAKGEGP